MEANRAIVVDPSATARLALREAATPQPLPSEALVRVEAISLNRGEVRMSQSAEAGWRPGWDLAGMVEQAAADGSGPPAGSRVVGFMRRGGWARYVAVPSISVAAIPDAVGFAQAATLPVAGLTAYHALRKGGLLLGRPVLVTGATGGVGDFAIQLARLSGAKVHALVRREDQVAQVREAGAHEVHVEDIPQAAFWHILDSVGGETLSQALRSLDEGGMVVSFGTTGGGEVTFNAQKFYGTGGLSHYGFILFDEFTNLETPAKGLARLAELVASEDLKPRIALEANWSTIGETAQKLLNRAYPGKAVLHVE